MEMLSFRRLYRVIYKPEYLMEKCLSLCSWSMVHYMSAYDFLLFSSHDLVKVCYVMRQELETLRVPLTVWEDLHCCNVE